MLSASTVVVSRAAVVAGGEESGAGRTVVVSGAVGAGRGVSTGVGAWASAGAGSGRRARGGAAAMGFAVGTRSITPSTAWITSVSITVPTNRTVNPTTSAGTAGFRPGNRTPQFAHARA